MNALKNIFFIALCLLIGLGIGKGYVYLKRNVVDGGKGFEKHEDPPRLTGEGDAPGKRGFTLQAGDLASLPSLLKEYESMFATTVGVEYSPALGKAELAAAVKEAHQRRMHVVLLPPAQFSAGNPYSRPLKEIAAEAQEAGIDFFCISWLKTEPEESYWRGQAAEVRSFFQGRIILAATPDVLPWITFWNAADVIGAIGPVGIAYREAGPDSMLEVKDLRVAWDSALSSMESLARINDKPLALLRMNVPPVAGNPAVQKLAYEGLLIETKGRAKHIDMLLFNWSAADFPRKQLESRIANAWDPSKPKPPDAPVTDASEMGVEEAGDGGGDGG